MEDLRDRFLAACRAFAEDPTEANHRRMQELVWSEKVFEREPIDLPREKPELAQVQVQKPAR
jgi:hypothetical protein